MKTSGNRILFCMLVLATCGLSVVTARSNARPKHITTSGDKLAQIDSIQRWAHHFADSLIAEIGGEGFGNGMDHLKNELEHQKNLRLDAMADSVFGELRSQLAILPGHLHLIPMKPQPVPNTGATFSDESHHYFLKVVPGVGKPKTSSQQVGKNLWLIEEDRAPPTE